MEAWQVGEIKTTAACDEAYQMGRAEAVCLKMLYFREISEKHQKTTAQVMLRWQIQRGVVVIPKSVHYERMVENFNVFDFMLNAEDMAKIAELNKKKSSFFSHYDPAMVEWFVQVVKERKNK